MFCLFLFHSCFCGNYVHSSCLPSAHLSTYVDQLLLIVIGLLMEKELKVFRYYRLAEVVIEQFWVKPCCYEYAVETRFTS